MIVFAVVFLVAAGVFLIVKRAEVTSLHNAAIGARLHPGCAIAEGLVVLVLAAALAILAWRGWLD